MDGEVSSEAFSGIMTIETEHVSIVSRPIQLWVSRDEVSVLGKRSDDI